MKITIIIFLGIAVILLAVIAVHKANQYNDMKTERDILKRRNETLETRFEQNEQANGKQFDTQTEYDATETLRQFAAENGCRLEPLEEPNNQSWNVFTMKFQGGSFAVYTYEHQMLVVYPNFAGINYQPNMYAKIMEMCYHAQRFRFRKLAYEYDDEENALAFTIEIELFNPSKDLLGGILDSTWDMQKWVSEQIDMICKECGSDAEPSDPNSDDDVKVNEIDSDPSLQNLPLIHGGEA
jgi:hypothetical protein